MENESNQEGNGMNVFVFVSKNLQTIWFVCVPVLFFEGVSFNVDAFLRKDVLIFLFITILVTSARETTLKLWGKL